MERGRGGEHTNSGPRLQPGQLQVWKWYKLPAMSQGLRVLLISGSLLGGLLLSPAGMADTERGRLLYENHCMSCHESVVHIREQRKAVNPGELRGAIQRWAAELKLRWQDADVNDVYQYLNNRYYKFQP